ncbi:MAG TPA: hypothetical protein VGX49_12945 [Jatrophihabitans sp.]|jgi:hypothetical protein|nr:hypothetical protein [Jatrophihabitans sp.]
MTAPHHDDLEHRLTELFQQRAATVTRARPVDFGSDSGTRTPPANLKQARFGTHRQNLGVLAAAAAVFVAIAATILGIQANRHQPAPPLSTGSHPTSKPTPTPTGSSNTPCIVQMPAGWQQAITAGAFAGDRDLSAVTSANGGTGDYLAIRGDEPASRNTQIYSNLTVSLFHGTGGKVIFTPAHSTDFVQADPTSAIAPDWVTFGVLHTENDSYQVMLYQRSTGGLRSLASDKQSPQGKVVSGVSVIAAGKVYWLAFVDGKPEVTTLESWDLARGRAAGSAPAANATGLLAYGSGVALIHQGSPEPTSDITATVRNGAGTPLTKAQLDAMTNGANFSFDGTRKLSWLRYDNGSISYSTLVVGGTGVSTEPLIPQPTDITARNPVEVGISPVIFPFTNAQVNGSPGLLDLRTGTAVTLPEGFWMQAVVGDDVIFGTGTHFTGAASGSTGLSLVPLTSLPPVRC